MIGIVTFINSIIETCHDLLSKLIDIAKKLITSFISLINFSLILLTDTFISTTKTLSEILDLMLPFILELKEIIYELIDEPKAEKQN